MATLTLTDIRKSFGGNDILKGISLDVKDGEFLSLVGASGCGKSTLLRIISGLDVPDSGSIVINGKAVEHATPKARNLAMVFQDYALYPHMTVAQNMQMPLLMGHLPLYARLPGARFVTPYLRATRREIATKVETVARQLRIDHLLDRRPAQLSGGQRQRVALGRALVRNPQLFLMDEPLSNLDAKLRVEVRKELVELHRSSGLTFIYVTHDQTEAMTMSDRVALLQAGKLLQVAPPATLYGNPASIEVAQFIGSPEINLLPARVEGGCIRIDELVLPFDTGLPVGRDVILGLRPEALYPVGQPGLTSQPAKGSRMSFQFSLTSTEDMGGEVVLYGSLTATPDILLRLRVQKSAGLADSLDLPPRFLVEAPLSAALLFDASGSREIPPRAVRQIEASL